MRAFLITIILIGSFFCITTLSALQLILDPKTSPCSSSQNIISFENQVFRLQDRIRDKNYDWITRSSFEGAKSINEYSFGELLRQSSKSRYGFICYSKMFLRVLEQGLVWHPINYCTMLLQHEVFGHGYRGRDLGKSKVTVKGYGLSFNGAYTSFEFNQDLTPTDLIALTIGGTEGNRVLANSVEKSWLSKGSIDGRQASLWRSSCFDLLVYMSSVIRKSSDEIFYAPQSEMGNDMISYFHELNHLYGSNQSIEAQIANGTKRAVMSFLLNPFTYLSWTAELSHIFLNSSIPIPGLPMGPFKFLPSYSFGLTPFGPENIYKGYLWNQNISPTTFYVREGTFSQNQYLGLGIENQAIIKTKVGHLGARLDLWNQPKLITRAFSNANSYDRFEEWKKEAQGDYKKELFNTQFGGAFSFFYKYPFTRSDLSNIWMQLGYKTEGYLPGESLSHNVLARFGLQIGF